MLLILQAVTTILFLIFYLLIDYVIFHVSHNHFVKTSHHQKVTDDGFATKERCTEGFILCLVSWCTGSKRIAR